MERAGSQVREYVTVLKSLIEDREAAFHGDFYNVEARLQMPWAPACPVVVAALGPRMLQTAGELADGTVTWMVGLKTLSDHIAPRIQAAAAAAGRPAPRICISLPTAVCDDEAAARAEIASRLGNYGTMPSYERMIEIEGGSVEPIALCGPQERIVAQLRQFAAAGATEVSFNILPIGDDPAATVTRTRAVVKELVGEI
jgi:alkanesulfonate monooxygenase SsuD/methylene tetrahydromethanopterin reductase-like flavin-dependent oxidoreductase (luciferase family)